MTPLIPPDSVENKRQSIKNRYLILKDKK